MLERSVPLVIQRTGQYTLHFPSPPGILSFAAVAGKKEAEGPLGKNFDAVFDDTTLGTDSFEKAESALQGEALLHALKKAGLQPQDLSLLLAGDLLNQCISSTFGLREFGIPFLGLYGACSTMVLSLGLAAVLTACGAADRAAAVTSSHFASAERQFRLPLEYGGQRPPTAQWTATASGCVILTRESRPLTVQDVCFGSICDLGITDMNNMGAAMAPAAAQTLTRYLRDTGTFSQDYDAIFTGDLGYIGSQLLMDLMEKEGFSLQQKHHDCGIMLFDRNKQDVHAGGSGCGCSAGVLGSTILPAMQQGALRNILFIATGALMSPTSSQQGESIPGIAHLIHLSRAENG